MDANKSKHYDIIKVFTTILVVVAHATRMYTEKGVVTPINGSTVLSDITYYIYSFHMPLYICVSGMVYGYCVENLGKYSDKWKFIKNKAVRLLVPYFAFGFLYVAPVMVVLGFTDESYVRYCLNGIILGTNSRHLWFVLVLFFIFVICILARKIMKNVNPVFIILVLLMMSYMSLKASNLLMINNLLYYFIYFYIGYIVNRHYDKVRLLKNPVVFIMLFVIVLFTWKCDDWAIKVVKAICGSGMILGIVQHISTKICDTRLYKGIKRNSYGIYLFHPMIIYILFFYLGNCDISPYLLCTFVIIVSFGASYLFTVILRKIKLGILIGE